MDAAAVPTYLRPQKRVYTCQVCGRPETIVTRQVEKWVIVHVHPDSRGSLLPVMQRLEEGLLVQ